MTERYARRLTSSRLKRCEEFCDPRDLHAAKASQRQQVHVTRHDGVRTGGDGALDDPVIVRVSGNHVQRFGWNDALGERREFGPQTVEAFR